MATISPKKRSIDISQKPVKRKKANIRVFLLNYVTLSVFLISMICFTCFLYLSAFNHISTQGVIINELERSRSELIIENEVWNMRIAQLKSLDVIDQQDVVNRMPTVDPAEIEFIDLDRQNQEEGE